MMREKERERPPFGLENERKSDNRLTVTERRDGKNDMKRAMIKTLVT